jgi:SAM-dependent methyltransferase
VSSRTLEESVIWHDVECAAYAVDLDVWHGLAGERPGPLLDLGCGTGRVALELVARGVDVTGVDSDPALVSALAARARERSLRVRTAVADARSFELARTFALVIAPMQVVQLLGGASGRSAMLRRVRRHLEPGGLFAAALADPFDGVPDDDPLPPLPDVREQDGWVFSSTPVGVQPGRDATVIERLRQAVSPSGELTASVALITLDRLDPGELESEAERMGYRALPRRFVPETEGYVGSTVVVLEAV